MTSPLVRLLFDPSILISRLPLPLPLPMSHQDKWVIPANDQDLGLLHRQVFFKAPKHTPSQSPRPQQLKEWFCCTSQFDPSATEGLRGWLLWEDGGGGGGRGRLHWRCGNVPLGVCVGNEFMERCIFGGKFVVCVAYLGFLGEIFGWRLCGLRVEVLCG